MSRRPKAPLRNLAPDEITELQRYQRSPSAPAASVIRAVLLLAVHEGRSFQDAARSVGRRSGDAVAHLVARFNTEGLAALHPRHGGGQPRRYGPAERTRILREVRRTPTPETDGTATWSLTLLRKALRSAPDGLPTVSTFTLWQVLHEAGYTHQRTRTWCPTGQVQRRRKAGVVTVADPDGEAKKN